MSEVIKNDMNQEKKKKTKFIVIGIVVILALVFIGFAINTVLNKDDDSIYPKDAVEVEMDKAYKDTVTNVISVKGTIDFIDTYTLYADTTGKITSLVGDVGDEIKAGETIVTYDDNQKTTLERSLKDADIGIRLAESALEGVLSPADQAEVESADNAIVQAENGVEAVELRIDDTNLSIAQTEDNLDSAKRTRDKNKQLLDADVITEADYEKTEDAVKEIENSLTTQKNSLKTLNNELDLAKKNVSAAKTSKRLIVNKNSSAAVQSQAKQSRLQIEQAQLQKENIKEEISDITVEEELVSGGTIIEKFVDEGEAVADGTPLLKIADLSSKNLIIKADIPENDAKDLEVGQKVEIKMGDMKNTTYDGKVSKVAPLATKKQTGETFETMVATEIEITSKDTNLKSGYTVDVDITTRVNENAICIPLTATTLDSDGDQYVFVVNKVDWTIEKRSITPLSYSGSSVETEEVKLDETVILNPSSDLTEESFVKPIGGV